MARPLRIEYPGAVYHITSRGNAREGYKRFVAHGISKESSPWDNLNGQIFLADSEFVRAMGEKKTGGRKFKRSLTLHHCQQDCPPKKKVIFQDLTPPL